MIQGTFDVAVDTPKLHRRGTLVMKSEGESIVARLTAGEGFVRDFDGTCQDKDFVFAGTDEFPSLGQVTYEAKGNVWGNSVTLTCTTDAGKVEIFGTRLSESAGDLASSHDYIMAASTGSMTANENTMYSGRYADGG